MAFVRSKTVKGQEYFYWVENTWEDGRTKQTVLAYLGRHSSVRAAHAHWVRESKKPGATVKRKRYAATMANKLKRYLGD